MPTLSDHTLCLNDFPKSYEACFLEGCSLKDTCLHYLYNQLLPSTTTCGRAIRPSALDEANFVNDHCPHYQEAKQVDCYSGFSHMFDEVKKKDLQALRQEIYQYLRGRSNFYRYSNAEKGCLLTQPMADQIKDIFARYGYGEPKYENAFKTFTF